ncbi:MFS transporter [Paenibacillus sp. Z3-2]
MQFMLSKVVSRFGDSIDSIAYSWMVYILTGSKVLMGRLLAVNFLPNILLGLFAGALVDRMSLKKVIVITNTGRGLFVGITALLFGLGQLEVWHLFVITILNSLLKCPVCPDCFPNRCCSPVMPCRLPQPEWQSSQDLQWRVHSLLQ